MLRSNLKDLQSLQQEDKSVSYVKAYLDLLSALPDSTSSYRKLLSSIYFTSFMPRQLYFGAVFHTCRCGNRLNSAASFKKLGTYLLDPKGREQYVTGVACKGTGWRDINNTL